MMATRSQQPDISDNVQMHLTFLNHVVQTMQEVVPMQKEHLVIQTIRRMGRIMIVRGISFVIVNQLMNFVETEYKSELKIVSTLPTVMMGVAVEMIRTV